MRRHQPVPAAIAAAVVLLGALPALARDPGMKSELLDRYEARSHKSDKGGSLPYRLLVPPAARESAERGKKYPLVLFLHGAGERGDDNKSQLKWGGALLATGVQQKEPAFVVAPQCPNGKQWANTPWGKGSYSTEEVAISDELRVALEIVEQVKREFPVDENRVYVMGLSMGGYGTWDAIARHPERFAAAVPICGGGDPASAESIAKQKVGVWAFHGGADTVVPPQGLRDMAEALKKAGAEPKYTEFDKVGHDSWKNAWNEPGLLDWLFAQKRTADTKRQ